MATSSSRQWLVANVNRIRNEVRLGIQTRANGVANIVRFGYSKDEATNIVRRKTAYR